ncbi:MAG: ABC transporter permease [Clostridia bacterium]|nr:ABC transporter permease [Clostridia bacterium]
MAGQIHGVHEPLFHISKREDCSLLWAILVRLAAIALALVVCGVVIVMLTGLNPVEVYAGIIDGAVGSSRRLWVTIRDTLALLLVAVALTPAFKMRFWNVGGEGQVLIGATATAAVMINFGDKLPAGALFAAMIAAAMLAGMVWGIIPALFKAGWNTNETLFTLMMNYVATQFVAFCIVYWENPAGSNSVGIINSSTKSGWLPALFGMTYGWNLLIVVVITAFMYVYLRYSKQGYEIAYVGQSVNTARYAGISVKKVIIRTMSISGALCGLAGFILVSGAGHTISTTLAGGRGFTAIVVAWLSKLNTFTMMIVSFLLTFMAKGAIQIASQFSLNENASEIITGILLFFVLGCEFFISYKVEFRHRRKED